MKIIENDFILTRVSDNSLFFDLELLLPVVNKETGVTRNEFKVVAYGLPMPTAIQRIAMHRAETKGDCNLSTYIDRFEAACNSLTKLKIF